MARVLLVAALALLAQGSLVVLLNSTARCLDGSAPAMAVRLASGSGGTASRQWVLDFEGGGWCTSWEECVERSKGARGSSRGWAAERAKGEGLLSRHFARFSSARLLYCDGASFLGTAGPVSRGGTTLHFAGHAVALALVRHLISDFGLAWASDVLVTGCSAGGLAALALADTLRALLPDVPRFKVAPLSGLFPHWGEHGKRMERLAALQKVFGGKTEGVALFEAVATPAMPLQSAYDRWGLRNVMPEAAWSGCVAGKEVPLNCTLAQRQQLAGRWYGPFTEALLRSPAAWRARNGLFVHSEPTHCFTARAAVAGVWHDDALALWFFDVATVSRYLAPAWPEQPL